MAVLRWVSKFFHGGISGDQFMGIPSSVQSAKNVDLRANGRQVVLAAKPVRNASAVITDWIMAFVTIQSTGDIIAFGDTGKIYRQTAGTGNFALVYTDTSNRKITDGYEYNSYLYWTTNTKLHRIAVANIDGTWTPDVTEDYKTFTNGNATHHPMIEVYNQLYIGDGKNVAELSSAGVFTGTKLTIFGDEIVVALTFNGSYVRIYARRTTSVPQSRCYLWDTVSSDYNQFFTFKGLVIHAAVEKANLDYVLAGGKPVLLASTGLDYQILKQLPNFTTTNSATFNHNTMTASESLVYFGACESGTNTMNRGVWSFGAKEKDYPQCLGNENTTTNASATDLVAAVHYTNGKIYSGWKNSSVYGVDITDPTLYSTTGEIVTRAWDGDAGYQKKEIIGVKMAFKTLADGEQIDLYLRRNLATTWGSAVLTAAYSDTADRDINYKELPTNSSGDPFNFLEAKVQLTAGTNQGTTPALTDLMIDSNYIEVI
jgi:hypothetical protein